MTMGTKLQKIVKILSEKYEINEWWERYTPFETLVSIILSQRTYWKNVKTATERFAERFNGVVDVTKADVKEIEKLSNQQACIGLEPEELKISLKIWLKNMMESWIKY